MKKCLLALCAFAFCSAAGAQTVLSIDFNERVVDQTTNTANFYPGFDPFLINSNTSITAVQSGNSTRTFAGGLTVTLAGVGAAVNYDDRLRAVPANSGAFTQGALLRDFVFNGSATEGSGLSLTIDGLIASQFYRVTIWSYDNSSTGNRASDWTANGVLVKSNYAFNGSTLPTSDSQYQFNFKTPADGTGRIVVEGRRNPATSSAGGVFINAMQVEITTGDPDPPVIGTQPVGHSIYQGDNGVFAVGVSGGSAPLSFQWFRDTNTLLVDATNTTLVVSNAQLADAGAYTVVVSNVAASVTSAPAALVVFPVSNILSGLLAYWPLDTLTDSTPDLSGNANTLWATNLDASNVTTGQRGTAFSFNGTDEFLMRTNGPGETLPASAYPAYSVAMWVQGNFVGQSDRRVFSEGSSTNNSPLMTIGTDNRTTTAQTNGVDIFIRENNGANPVNHRHSSLVAFDGDWHHIAWVDNNGFGQLYVDGVQDTNNFNYTRGILTPNITSLAVVYRTNAQALFNGVIDDVAVWRRALTLNEVQSVMANGAELPRPRILNISVGSSNVNIAFFSPNPAGPHFIEETSDLNPPIVGGDVTNVIFSVNGSTVTAEFPQSPGAQRFYQIRSE